MSLHLDLLEQAEHLARRERYRPRQASLRRAVSASYYALFHLLIHEGAGQVVRGATDSSPLRALVSRAFEHGEMARAARAFLAGYGSLPAPLRGVVSGVSPDLVLVARAFIQLQQERHDADYNTAARFSRSDALNEVSRAREAFAAWNRVRSSPEATAFLLHLLLRERWTR